MHEELVNRHKRHFDELRVLYGADFGHATLTIYISLSRAVRDGSTWLELASEYFAWQHGNKVERSYVGVKPGPILHKRFLDVVAKDPVVQRHTRLKLETDDRIIVEFKDE